jgi:putative alpha-1,2-mannosidase
MAINYNQLALTAEKLIQDNGKTLTLSQKSGGTFTPSTNSFSGETTTNNTIYGVFEQVDRNRIDGQNVKKEDKIILATTETASVTIQERDTIIDGSDNWQIVNVEEVKPADKVIYYRLQVRR